MTAESPSPSTSPGVPDLNERLVKLENLVRGYGSVAVALSGGIDSVVLLHVCRRVLGDRVLAVTSVSVTTPEPDVVDAEREARSLGVRFHRIETQELGVESYAENPPSRCYFCKDELYSRIRAVAAAEGFEVVVDGGNLDDTGDHRPGRRAAEEVGVRSPLEEAGFSKAHVRALARRFGIRIADKPASACLASRFPYGTRITREEVLRVAGAESVLRELGFEGFRVRHHGDVARIEVSPDRVADLAAEPVRSEVVVRLKALGYRFVAVDLEGYRSGSLNAGLAAESFEA